MLWSVMCSEDLGSFFIDLWDHLGGSLKTLFSFRLTRMFDYYFFDLKYFFIVIEMRLGVFNFEDRWRSFIFGCLFVWQTWIWDWFTRFWLGFVRLVKVWYELQNLWIWVMQETKYDLGWFILETCELTIKYNTQHFSLDPQ